MRLVADDRLAMRYVTVVAIMALGTLWLTRASHLVDRMRRRGAIRPDTERARQIATARAVGVLCLLLGVISFLLFASGANLG